MQGLTPEPRRQRLWVTAVRTKDKQRGLSLRVRREVAQELEILLTRLRVYAYIILLAANFILNISHGIAYWKIVFLLELGFALTAFIPYLQYRRTGRLWLYQPALAQFSDMSLNACLSFGFARLSPEMTALAMANLSGGTVLLIAMSGMRLNRGIRLGATLVGAADILLFITLYPGQNFSMLMNWVLLSFVLSIGIEHVVILAAERSAMSRFLPKEVAERIARDPKGLEPGGAMLEATIMFTDLRNFTSLSERLGPEEVMTLLNRLHSLQMQAVFDQGGMVNKFIGDGMLAVFGAPAPLEQDAGRALNAALAIRDGVRNLAREIPDLRIGAGIHRGAIIAGNVGSDMQLEYTVIGDTVNVASRLESLNKEFGTEILISKDAAEALKGSTSLKRLGGFQVKGRSAEVEVFTVEE